MSSSATLSWDAALAALQRSDTPIDVLRSWRHASAVSATKAARLWQQALHCADARKASGTYYTAEKVARTVVRQSIAHMPELPARILEPSCGGGTLLVAALYEGADAWKTAPRELATRMHAWDLDPAGVLLAQWRIAEHFGDDVATAVHWHVGDALDPPTSAPSTFEWILGNPPFGNAIDRATRRSKDQRAHYARRFPLAARGAFDKCALFIELAAQRCAPDGHITLILPRSWLAQPASTHLRKALAKTFELREIAHLPDDAFFDASVSTIAIHLTDRRQPDVAPDREAASERQSNAPLTLVRQIDGSTEDLHAAPLLRRGNWGAALHPFAHILTVAAPALVDLSEFADFSAGASTAEAYEWAPHVQDLVQTDVSQSGTVHAETVRAARDDERALLIAGMIEPFHSDWGNKTTRYLGKFYERPVLSLQQLSERRQALHARPRALLPTLSVALEAFPDLHGEYIGAVSTISAWPLPSKISPDVASPPTTHTQVLFLTAMLNSAWCRLHYACFYASLALQGGNTQVSKNKLASLRVPAAWGELLCATGGPTHVAQHNAALQAQLSTFDIKPLSKRLPSIERFSELIEAARNIATHHEKDTIAAHLASALQSNAADTMYSAHADILLLALSDALLRHIEAPS